MVQLKQPTKVHNLKIPQVQVGIAYFRVNAKCADEFLGEIVSFIFLLDYIKGAMTRKSDQGVLTLTKTALTKTLHFNVLAYYIGIRYGILNKL